MNLNSHASIKVSSFMICRSVLSVMQGRWSAAVQEGRALQPVR